MSLAAGTKLGPYEIVAPLGAGGMGEVYRARDTRLGRDVAIKVLPQHLSDNADVRARFEREAKTISSLNHPNICTLFDIGREGTADYLVMELVEGDTLAQRLAKGALPMADVLRIGGQVADALDRAHRAGIVHRDLKPGNIMLTKSGAKLMDFGLARASAASGPVSASGTTMGALTQSPTVASPLTAAGTIVGTFQYMSPEQLEGGEADARSDLWALGCVLYEMATGKRAFDGRSQASLITAIMGSRPAPLAQVAPMSPPALERVVDALLAKAPDDRIQTAHDVKLQLGWIAEPGSQVSSASAIRLLAGAAKRRSVATPIALGIGALGVLAIAAAAWLVFAQPKKVIVSQIPTPPGFTLSRDWSSMALSPNGDEIVAVIGEQGSLREMWRWRLDSPDPISMNGASSCLNPNWSPDGGDVAFFDMQAKTLSRMPASGGSATRLCDVSDPRGVAWGSKGVLVFAGAPTGPLLKIPASGGNAEVATQLDVARGEASHRFPTFLPDGQHFLFTALPEGPHGYTIRIGSLDSKQSKVVLECESGATYVEPGYLIFSQRGKLTAQRFDTGKLECVGERYTIGEAPVRGDMDGEPVATGSRDGKLLYPDIGRPDTRLEWLDRTGETRGVVATPKGDWLLSSISPDQHSALATRGGDLWQVDLDRGVPTALVHNVDPLELAVWSPDGQRIAATTRGSGHEVVRILNSGGSGARDSIATLRGLFLEAQAWAPDGSLLVAVLGALEQGAPSGTSWDLWRVQLDGSPATPYLATPAFERYAALSPDGRWALCASRHNGRLDIAIDSYPIPGHRVQIVAGAPFVFESLMWGRGGREVIYDDAEGAVISVPLTIAGDRIRAGTPVKLFDRGRSILSMATRDGERFLVTRRSEDARGPAMRLVQNWTGLIRK